MKPGVIAVVERPDPSMPPDLEERLRDLLCLCEGLRAVCSCGQERGLTLSDAQPVAMLAAQLAKDLQRTFFPPAPAAPDSP